MAERHVEVVVREYVKALKAHGIKVEKAVLFGSHSQGRASDDSDIDVAVVSPEFGRDYVEEAVLLKKISEEVDLDISPRPYSLEEYRSAKRGQFLHDEILRKGKVVEV